MKLPSNPTMPPSKVADVSGFQPPLELPIFSFAYREPFDRNSAFF
jgi:hypothetical protein